MIENRFLVGIHYKVPLPEIPTVFEPAYTALGDLFKKQGVAPAAHVAYYYEISSGVNTHGSNVCGAAEGLGLDGGCLWSF